jgi:hypothetical protein
MDSEERGMVLSVRYEKQDSSDLFREYQCYCDSTFSRLSLRRNRMSVSFMAPPFGLSKFWSCHFVVSSKVKIYNIYVAMGFNSPAAGTVPVLPLLIRLHSLEDRHPGQKSFADRLLLSRMVVSYRLRLTHLLLAKC